MDEISMEKALEAYNTIREYCRAQQCSNCLFSDESEMCILFNASVPEEWQKLDLN